MTKGLIRRCAVAAAAWVLFAGSAPSLAVPDWDIVGIRLGMTPEQARALSMRMRRRRKSPRQRGSSHTATVSGSTPRQVS